MNCCCLRNQTLSEENKVGGNLIDTISTTDYATNKHYESMQSWHQKQNYVDESQKHLPEHTQIHKNNIINTTIISKQQGEECICIHGYWLRKFPLPQANILADKPLPAQLVEFGYSEYLTYPDFHFWVGIHHMLHQQI